MLLTVSKIPQNVQKALKNFIEILNVDVSLVWIFLFLSVAFSALTLLLERQEVYPACKKTEWSGTGVVICLETCIWPSWCHCHCFSKIQIGFTFLVLAHPGIPGQRAVKRVCVCVCVIVDYHLC